MDLRRTVREALARRVADTTWWPPEDASRFHNRLLDDCGDAARPEVALLMRLHARDIGGRLPPAVLSHAAWLRERSTLVTVFANELAAEGVVAADDVAWAVESWAIALAVIENSLLTPPPPRAPVRRSGSGARAAAPAARRGHAQGAAPLAVAGIGAGGAPGRAWPFGPIARAAPTPNHWTHRVNLDALTFGGMAVLGLFSAGAEWMMVRQSRASAARIAAQSPPAAVRSSAATMAPERNNAPRIAVALPSTRGAPGAAPRGAAPSDADTVHLRDGRTIVGALGVITESHLYLTERASLRPFEFRLGAVERVVTQAGRELRFALASGDSALAPSLIVRGVGGRYVVRRRVLAFSGDSSCATATRLMDPVATSEEEIAHAPGAATFAMPSRPGVTGTIGPDGRFETVVLSGERALGDFSWHMVGHFSANGFVAEADASTAVVTRWRESQSCRFLTELIGVRKP